VNARFLRWLYLALALLLLTPTASALAHGEPVIVVDPSVAAAGGTIVVTGTEMEPGEVFSLVLENASTSIALGEATAEGEGEEGGFAVSLVLPADLPAGFYTLRAFTEEGESAIADLTVTAAAAQADAGPATAQEPSGEQHVLDRSKPVGQVAGVAVLALGSVFLGVWLIRRT